MNKKILSPGVQYFINNNLQTDILSVVLKKQHFEGISTRDLVQQIEGKKRCARKLPLWFGTQGIYYPAKRHIEQASSEGTARYKAGLVQGQALLDLTGGFGVDAYYFSQKVAQVHYCETNGELAAIAAHNFEVLRAGNITAAGRDGESFLERSAIRFNWIYLDPSRRDQAGNKVFRFADCIPEVPGMLDLLFSKAPHILIKASPLLDISQGTRELRGVTEVHVIAINNEVKELLWLLEGGASGAPTIKTVHFGKYGTERFDFVPAEEKTAVPTIGAPLNYLYEPNAAIMKSGAFKLTGNRYSLTKLHEHSHLYTSDDRIDFPGRVFRIRNVAPYKKGSMQRYARQKANITLRNFPENVASVRKKFHIGEGGSVFLFLTRDATGRTVVLQCEKVR